MSLPLLSKRKMTKVKAQQNFLKISTEPPQNIE